MHLARHLSGVYQLILMTVQVNPKMDCAEDIYRNLPQFVDEVHMEPAKAMESTVIKWICMILGVIFVFL